MAIQQCFFDTTYPQIIGSVNLANQTSNSSRSLSITSHQIGDMIFAMTANRSTTAPTLLSGYTNIVEINNSLSRSLRLQYKFATNSTETISWTGAYGFIMAIRNANKIVQHNTVNLGTSASTISLPDISNLDISSKSLIIAGTYLSNSFSSISSPYAFTPSNSAGFIQKNTEASHISKTITSSGTLTRASWAVEIL
jgi:hypothetical protein